MFYPTGPQSPAFGVIRNSKGFRPPGEPGQRPKPLKVDQTLPCRRKGGVVVCTLGSESKVVGGGSLADVCLLNLLFSRASLLRRPKKKKREREKTVQIQFSFFSLWLPEMFQWAVWEGMCGTLVATKLYPPPTPTPQQTAGKS